MTVGRSKNFRIALLTLICVSLAGMSSGQNLIPDPGFEDWNGGLPTVPPLNQLNQWYPVNGSPDYFHEWMGMDTDCAAGQGQNSCGTAYEGQATVGCYKANGANGTKEWAGTELVTPMIPGSCYSISYWLQNKKDNPDFLMETNQWGIFFSETQMPSFDPNTPVLGLWGDQWVSCQELIDDTVWHHIELTYVPDVPYTHAYIGYMGETDEATTNAWSMSPSIGFYVWYDMVEVIEVTEPYLDPIPDVVACAGAEFTITVDSNLPITWSTGESGPILTATEVLPGVYVYEAFAGEGEVCEIIESVTITVTDCCEGALELSGEALDSSSCPDQPEVCDGSASVTVDMGSGPFTYMWDDPSAQTTAMAIDLCPGTYTATVFDVNQCAVIVELTIGSAEQPIIDLTVTAVSCIALMDGAIETIVSGGESPFDFIWDGTIMTEDVQNLDTSWHYLEVTDSFGCSYLDSAYVPLSDTMFVFLDYPTQVCIDAPEVVAEPSLSNGTWTGPGVIDTSTGLFDPSVAGVGVHHLNHVTPDVCNTVFDLEITVRDHPQTDFIVDPAIGCADLQATLLMSTPAIAGSYIWGLGDGSISTAVPPFSHVYTEVGSYDLTLSITDAYGCANTDTILGAVEVLPRPSAEFTYSPLEPSVYSPQIEFYDSSEGAEQWSWDFGNGTGSSSPSPSVTYSSPDNYVVTLIVGSEVGCTDTVSHRLSFRGDVAIYIPNAFSPNGDELNEYFQVRSESQFSEFELLIYDRWGSLVFRSIDINDRWNGEVNSEFSSLDHLFYAPDGVYSYIITYSAASRTSTGVQDGRLAGWINVMR